MILFSIGVYALGIHRTTKEPMKRSCTAAITGFIIIMAVHSFKGWQIELDPINVWYWLLVGILFRLPELRFDTVVEARRQAEAVKKGRQRPTRRQRTAQRKRVPRYR
jgi:hypothetical protein